MFINVKEKLINLDQIVIIEKENDTEILFHLVNSQVYVIELKDKKERDDYFFYITEEIKNKIN